MEGDKNMKTIAANDGKEIVRISRWIKIRQNYNVSKRNSLYYYATDENGYREGQTNYNPENGLYLDYFKFNGRTYAIEQFYRMDYPIFFENEDGKTSYIAGYDSENYYNPLMIEVDECGENVRLYEEKRA